MKQPTFAGFEGEFGVPSEFATAKFAIEAAEAALHFERPYKAQSFPECFQQFVAGRRDESQPAIPSPKLALQIDPYSPASAD
jgi:hypothetical protein